MAKLPVLFPVFANPYILIAPRNSGGHTRGVGTKIGVLDMYMTTGQVIRRIRKSVGMTQTELGVLISFSQPAVSNLENDGPAVHDVRTLRLVARALQVPLAILVVESNEEADMDRRQFFRAGALGAGTAVVASTPGRTPATASREAPTIRVGASDVAAISESVNQIHQLDLVVGGDRLCRLAVGQVGYVTQLLDTGTYSDEVGRHLTSVSAEMMTAAGWVHYDAGRLDEARRYYADAAQTANAAGDGIAAAHALINASMITYDYPGIGKLRNGTRQREGVHLTEAAQQATLRRGGPKLRALGAIREAEAHSVIGDKTAMVAAIARAHRAYDSTRGYDPEWVYLPEAEMNGITGKAHMSIGDYPTATTHLRAAMDGFATWPRQHSLIKVRLAENLIRAGDIAEGCWLLTTNFDEINGVASTRLHTVLDRIATDLRPHSAVSEVREFLGMAMARG